MDDEADLSGIEAVEADAEFLQTATAIVRSQTEVRCGVVPPTVRLPGSRLWKLLWLCRLEFDIASEREGLPRWHSWCLYIQAEPYLVSHPVLQAALRAGLESLSQADVGSALQVLFNLGEL